ncbi:MAG: C40 family peptidase [Thermoleophilia bacterium]
MRRTLVHLLAASALLIGAATAHAQTTTAPATTVAPATKPIVKAGPYDWAKPAADALVAEGAWPELAGADLRRNANRGDLDRALTILTRTTVQSGNPSARVSVWVANLQFVRALGLEPERQALNRLSTADGVRLKLPKNFGSEVLARELGLVHNHLVQFERYERSRKETVRLGDLVGMLARARSLSSWQIGQMQAFATIQLPVMSPARRALVQSALAQVGQPYIWGGDWPGPRSPWGPQVHGGFDCSGLVWWVFKGSPGPRQMALGRDLLGRTADDMAFEKPSERIDVASLIPGDLVFFGPGGPKAAKGTIEHEAIALGNGWIVQSSGSRGGVSVSNLATYWPSATAFGRRVGVVGP